MAGTLIIKLTEKTNPQSQKEAEFYCSGISIGSTFGFIAGSQILGDISNNQWTCGSAGVIDASNNIGVGVLIRKAENENKIKLDLLNIYKQNGNWRSPEYPKKVASGLGLHHNSLTPVIVQVEWKENNKITFIDKKEI